MASLCDSGKTLTVSFTFELYFFEDKNDINGFKGKDVVATLFVQGAEFFKCE